jgi:HAMP domain-containing protein
MIGRPLLWLCGLVGLAGGLLVFVVGVASRETVVAAVAVALALLGATAWLVHRSVRVPLERVVSAAERIARGDVQTRVDLAIPNEFGRPAARSIESPRTPGRSSPSAASGCQNATTWIRHRR